MSSQSAVVLAVVVLAWTTPAFAQADHLECYKITDTLAGVRYTADVSGLALQPGCVLKTPAKLLCVPATKANVVPAPPGAAPGPAAAPSLCYQVKCVPPGTSSMVVTDQFGSRQIAPRTARLLCAPAVIGTTTSTTLPPTRCCQGLGGPLCSDLPAATAASTCGGTLAAPGFVCDGATGNCAATRTGVSTCCQVSGPICFEGPLAALACTVPDAVVVPGAACTSSGTCVVP
jgi:hypothetical protein